MEEKRNLLSAVDWHLDHLGAERGASPHTLAAYRSDLHQTATELGSLGLDSWDDLAAPMLADWQSKLGPLMAPATQMRRLSSLRSFLKFLRRRGRLSDLILPDFLNRRKPKRLPKALTLDDLNRLLNAPDTATPVGLRDRCLMELLYGAGLRISEACSLRTDELLLDSAAIRVMGKRGKTRMIPLPRLTIPWIERWMEEGRGKLIKSPRLEVLVGARGGPLSRTTAGAQMNKLAVQAGIESHVTPHILRHTYAVHLLKGGADLRVVQDLLGHESIGTTQVYTQLDLEAVKLAYRQAHPRHKKAPNSP